MEQYDDDLSLFGEHGATISVPAAKSGDLEHDGARIHFEAYGSGFPVVLLHGGMGHGGNWAYQVPAVVESGYMVVVIDSRGHGRSTRDERPYSYELMASDTFAVMDFLRQERAVVAGWSDGACTALIMGSTVPERIAGVFYFACNMDPGGVKKHIEYGPALQRCIARHEKDYQSLSATPDAFKKLQEDVGLMQRTQPNFTRADLAAIRVPVVIAQSEHDEFIKREHAEYLAESIPGAILQMLPGVSHFAPLQRPSPFNAALIAAIKRFLCQF